MTDEQIIAAAEKVLPDVPLCVVGTDTYFMDVEEAQEEYSGQWAHPCIMEPLAIPHPKRTAEGFVEDVVERICEDAFEDAYDHVNGQAELLEAFTKALEQFNAAQTAGSWYANTKQVFQIPEAFSA